MRVQPFPATQWSLIDRARQSDAGRRGAALGVLLHRYMPALRAYLVLTRRMPPEQADDLLQSFIADKIIERNLLDRAERERGKFRSSRSITMRSARTAAPPPRSARRRKVSWH